MCAAYDRDVSASLGYPQGAGVTNLAEVESRHVRGLLADVAKRRPTRSSQAGAAGALKSFFRILVEDEQSQRSCSSSPISGASGSGDVAGAVCARNTRQFVERVGERGDLAVVEVLLEERRDHGDVGAGSGL